MWVKMMSVRVKIIHASESQDDPSASKDDASAGQDDASESEDDATESEIMQVRVKTMHEQKCLCVYKIRRL